MPCRWDTYLHHFREQPGYHAVIGGVNQLRAESGAQQRACLRSPGKLCSIFPGALKSRIARNPAAVKGGFLLRQVAIL